MKIRLANRIAESGLELFDDSYEYCENMTEEDGILVRSASLHDYQFSDTLLAIARAGAGVNNIPIEKCTEKGVAVFNTPGANANAVKELALCSLFLSSRDIKSAMEWVETIKEEDDYPKTVEKG